MQPLANIIGQNLEKLRKKRGLSLDKTAELTGVSKGMLASIEKGKTNPTVSTLWKIAMGLQVSFSYFMAESKTEIKKVKLKELKAFTDDSDHYHLFSLFPFHPGKKFEIYTIRLDAYASHVSEQHAGEEYILVGDGELLIEIGENHYKLETGDGLQFSPNQQHIYTNPLNKTVTIFNVIYYPE
ncbi:helix-turn-helix domain-containing protein [Niallia nealsonii]|uniref:DNA-binding protein n=1 Tax=Niallia nealsonii TaxID=115979 RepID=A0A2N0Z6F4_9BACI|nr:XRE family transcriptional regulator [Niallia nealsonii]PKG25098.1 DNA-binding protein [Niallia nealsonii]